VHQCVCHPGPGIGGLGFGVSEQSPVACSVTSDSGCSVLTHQHRAQKTKHETRAPGRERGMSGVGGELKHETRGRGNGGYPGPPAQRPVACCGGDEPATAKLRIPGHRSPSWSWSGSESKSNAAPCSLASPDMERGSGSGSGENRGKESGCLRAEGNAVWEDSRGSEGGGCNARTHAPFDLPPLLPDVNDGNCQQTAATVPPHRLRPAAPPPPPMPERTQNQNAKMTPLTLSAGEAGEA
jgi:hypothetical protein